MYGTRNKFLTENEGKAEDFILQDRGGLLSL